MIQKILFKFVLRRAVASQTLGPQMPRWVSSFCDHDRNHLEFP